MTVDEVIAAYLKLREAKESLSDKHKAEMAPLNEKMMKVEGWMQGELQKLGLQNFKGPSGTAYLQTVSSVTSESWDDTLRWILDTGAHEFLERRVSKTAVNEYMEQHGEAPPGISVTRATEVRIRKS